jgi:hypothetical protein
MNLQYFVYEGGITHDRADSASRDREILGEAMQAYNILGPVRASEEPVRRAGHRSEGTIRLVQNEHKVLSLGKVRELANRFRRDGYSGGISWRRNNDPSGTGGQDALGRGYSWNELLITGEEDRYSAVKVKPPGVVEVIRHGHCHLVSDFRKSSSDETKGLAAPG